VSLMVGFAANLILAQRAFAAPESLARLAPVAGEKYRPVFGVLLVLGPEPPRINERRFSRASILRRMAIASSKASTDMVMGNSV